MKSNITISNKKNNIMENKNRFIKKMINDNILVIFDNQENKEAFRLKLENTTPAFRASNIVDNYYLNMKLQKYLTDLRNNKINELGL